MGIETFRQDSSDLKIFKDENGVLTVGVTLAKPGVYPYKGDDGEVHYEFKPEHEILKQQFLADAVGLPVTDGHPPGLVVDESNITQYIKGVTHSAPTINGKNVDTVLSIFDPALRKEILAREKNHVSIGFRNITIEGDGEYEGVHYDRIQTDIRLNHIAVTKRGRCGATCSLKLDSEDAVCDCQIKGKTCGCDVVESNLVGDFNPDQPRDADGKFSSGGGSSSTYSTTRTEHGTKVIKAHDTLGGSKVVGRVAPLEKSGGEPTKYVALHDYAGEKDGFGKASTHDSSFEAENAIMLGHALEQKKNLVKDYKKALGKKGDVSLVGDYNPDQPRDSNGRFSSDGASDSAAIESSGNTMYTRARAEDKSLRVSAYHDGDESIRPAGLKDGVIGRVEPTSGDAVSAGKYVAIHSHQSDNAMAPKTTYHDTEEEAGRAIMASHARENPNPEFTRERLNQAETGLKANGKLIGTMSAAPYPQHPAFAVNAVHSYRKGYTEKQNTTGHPSYQDAKSSLMQGYQKYMRTKMQGDQALDGSFDKLREEVQEALNKKFPRANGNPGGIYYIDSLFPDSAIVRNYEDVEPDLARISYTVGSDGEISLGELEAGKFEFVSGEDDDTDLPEIVDEGESLDGDGDLEAVQLVGDFNPDQPRDELGRFAGGSTVSETTKAGNTLRKNIGHGIHDVRSPKGKLLGTIVSASATHAIPGVTGYKAYHGDLAAKPLTHHASIEDAVKAIEQRAANEKKASSAKFTASHEGKNATLIKANGIVVGKVTRQDGKFEASHFYSANNIANYIRTDHSSLDNAQKAIAKGWKAYARSKKGDSLTINSPEGDETFIPISPKEDTVNFPVITVKDQSLDLGKFFKADEKGAVTGDFAAFGTALNEFGTKLGASVKADSDKIAELSTQVTTLTADSKAKGDINEALGTQLKDVNTRLQAIEKGDSFDAKLDGRLALIRQAEGQIVGYQHNGKTNDQIKVDIITSLNPTFKGDGMDTLSIDATYKAWTSVAAQLNSTAAQNQFKTVKGDAAPQIDDLAKKVEAIKAATLGLSAPAK